MYRDVAQWSKIRHRVLVEGVSQRQIARETGISRETIRKMLAHPHPQPYGPRSRRYPKLGPHTASIQRMLRENATLPPAARLSVQAMYERIRDQEGFRGSYGAVKDYVRPISRDEGCIWEYAYDLLVSLDKKRAIDFPVLPVPRRSAGDLACPRRAVLPRGWPDHHNSSKARQEESKPGALRSSGCVRSFRRRSATRSCAARSAICPNSHACSSASMTAACLIATARWSFWRSATGWAEA